MKLKDEYAKSSDSADDKKDKTVLSDDAYAICDFMEQLMIKLDQAGRKLK